LWGRQFLLTDHHQTIDLSIPDYPSIQIELKLERSINLQTNIPLMPLAIMDIDGHNEI